MGREVLPGGLRVCGLEMCLARKAAAIYPIVTRPVTVARYRSMFSLGSFHFSNPGDMGDISDTGRSIIARLEAA